MCKVLDVLEGVTPGQQAPQLMGTPPVFEGPAYEPMGEVEDGGKEMYASFTPDAPPPPMKDPAEVRMGMKFYAQTWKTPAHEKWNKMANVTKR